MPLVLKTVIRATLIVYCSTPSAFSAKRWVCPGLVVLELSMEGPAQPVVRGEVGEEVSDT